MWAVLPVYIETVEHVLWECPLARNVWALSIGKIKKCTNVVPDFYSVRGDE